MKDSGLNLEKFIFICSCISFPLLIVNISKSIFQRFGFAFTIPFTLSQIMKTLVLVKHLSTPGFLNSY